MKTNLRTLLGKLAASRTRRGSSNARTVLVRLACIGLSTYIGWPLLNIEPPRRIPEMIKKPAVQRVRVHAPVRKVEETKREQIIIRAEKAPKRPIKPKVQKAIEAPLPPAPTPEPIVQAPPEPVPPPPQEIPQLAFPHPHLPGTPPAPPDDLPRPAYFSDKPGGTVVVLAVQLNSDNVVVMTDILVESNTPMNDLAFALATRGVQWKNVDPPIPPGELRWVEIRLDYAEKQDNSSVLP